MEGELAGRYRLGESLGGGPAGEVFAATGPDGEDYAIKLLPVGPAPDSSLLAGFLRAQSQLVGLRHPNLVVLHDVLVEDGVIALVQDRVPGGSLRQWLDTAGTLLPAELARIGAGIASALHELHSLGIVHGAVEPANILMDDTGSVRIPRLSDTATSLLEPRAPGSTSLLAASAYAAPEAGESGTAADLYALGVLLYELYCGVTPFVPGFVRAADEGPGRPGQLPEPLWDLIRLLLAFDPSFRPTADRTAAVLRAMAPDLLGVPVGQRLDRPPRPESAKDRQDSLPPSFLIGDQMYGEQLYSPPPRRRRRWVPIALATTVVAAGAITTVALTGTSPSPGPQAAAPVPTTTVQVTAPPSSAPGSTAQAAVSTSTSAPPGSPSLPAERYLTELAPVRGSFDSGQQTGAIAGKTYLHTLATRVYECDGADFAEYNLSKGFRRLVASAGLDDNSPDSTLKVQLEIFGDNRKLLSTTLELNKMVPIDLDLTGVLRLKIGWQPVKSGECGASGNHLDLGEAKVLGLPEEMPPPTTTG
ncbi:hypothetical protein SD37_16380 [Amycolatopsis orientalis]|uniref:non-specific serine/threonine protein kinase n=1 Tax=Amycolatopsis orientalis TaxID=31958 RepID=A0A193BXV1_AMYOR|nr:protein kinase [Amycolatopsis orientalis]ANN17066.1 hypothetical protein SD37_16380 [Amycolatopsis orientalis]